ncbi:MAG: hypothetical protein O7A06_08255 [Acidobacteria bacterium]|nr:hypothetical protein [Acidobacteriota bacterium]MCZ6750854.1 hypothetical protein [Acidobacteriota bacterium]
MNEMNEIVEKYASLEAEIAAKKGNFFLFALFLREDVPDRWDLMVSAPWLSLNKGEAVEYLVNEIKSHLGPQGLVNLSRIVLVDPNDPPARALAKAFHVEHGKVEVRDSNLFGLQVKHAFIITSKTPEAPVAK